MKSRRPSLCSASTFLRKLRRVRCSPLLPSSLRTGHIARVGDFIGSGVDNIPKCCQQSDGLFALDEEYFFLFAEAVVTVER